MEENVKPVYGLINFGEERELAKASFEYINRDIMDIKTNFIRLGFHLAECREMKYYQDFGYDNFYEFVEKNWQMEKSAVSRHINIFMKFSRMSGAYEMSDTCMNNEALRLDDKYKGYSYSQLSEMLQMDDKQISQVKPEMTVAEIRTLKKNWKKEKAPVSQKEKKKVATSQQEKKKMYTECAAYQFRKSCDGCYYSSGGECPFDKTGYVSCDVVPKQYIEYEGECCSFDETYLCQITDVIREYFYPEGKLDECPGCCIKCPKRDICQYTCVYACSKMKAAEQDQKEQEEFPILNNMEEREKFVLNFKQWNIWCRNELTEETYYKYDLPDGSAIVVRSYPYYLKWKKEETEGKELFLLKPGYKHFKDCETNMTAIKTHLKDLQKKK